METPLSFEVHDHVPAARPDRDRRPRVSLQTAFEGVWSALTAELADDLPSQALLAAAQHHYRSGQQALAWGQLFQLLEGLLGVPLRQS